MDIIQVFVTNWDEIHSLAKRGWLYRGQKSAKWPLQTSLDRCCAHHNVAEADRPRIEHELFREFRRTYHQYSHHIPEASSELEWMSLMQHHGAPTRLLDFTYSIYVAAYFALENSDDAAAVWACNGPWALKESLAKFEQAKKQNVNRLNEPFIEDHERLLSPILFKEPYVRAVCPLNPFRLNERLRVQKGAFLVPGDITASFADNLKALSGFDSAEHLIKIVIPHNIRAQALKQLFYMNISRTSLFPGLDGFAHSLGVYHPAFDPVTWV